MLKRSRGYTSGEEDSPPVCGQGLLLGKLQVSEMDRKERGVRWGSSAVHNYVERMNDGFQVAVW